MGSLKLSSHVESFLASQAPLMSVMRPFSIVRRIGVCMGPMFHSQPSMAMVPLMVSSVGFQATWPQSM